MMIKLGQDVAIAKLSGYLLKKGKFRRKSRLEWRGDHKSWRPRNSRSSSPCDAWPCWSTMKTTPAPIVHSKWSPVTSHYLFILKHTTAPWARTFQSVVTEDIYFDVNCCSRSLFYGLFGVGRCTDFYPKYIQTY